MKTRTIMSLLVWAVLFFGTSAAYAQNCGIVNSLNDVDPGTITRDTPLGGTINFTDDPAPGVAVGSRVCFDIDGGGSAINIIPEVLAFSGLDLLDQLDQTSGGEGIPICTPIVMNWGAQETEPFPQIFPPAATAWGDHVWYVKPIGSELDIELRVVNFGKQSLEVVGSTTPPLVVDATGLTQPPMGFDFATGSQTFMGLVPGNIYPVVVRVEDISPPDLSGPPASGLHYQIVLRSGANALALPTPTVQSLENSDTRWLINQDVAFANLDIRFNPGIPGSATTGLVGFRDPSGFTSGPFALVGVPSVFTVPGSLASLGGIWVMRTIPDPPNLV